MTDKLADAKRALLKISVEADHIYSDEIEAINSFITDHEATKAATSDDVLPRYGIQWENDEQPICQPKPDGYWTPWHLANAALRNTQGVTLPMDKWDEMWQRAYDRSRFSSVFNDKPTFKKAIEDELVIIALLDQHARGG